MDEARHCATLLYALRDGQPPKVVGVETQRGTISKLELMLLWARGATFAEAKAARKELLQKTKTKEWNWVVSSPVVAAPELWSGLKRARSAREIQEVSRRIRRWASEYVPREQCAVSISDALFSHADQVLNAKRLPNYPKAPKKKRPRSDDKRVEFFAKILAGLTLGIAPITAAKRLSHWRSQQVTNTESKERGDS